MSDPSNDDRTTAGVGEAVFSGLSITALWTLLLRKRLISADEAVMAMDAVILALEQAQEGSAAGSLAIEYARARAQHLMDTILEEAPATPFGPA